jgi:dihydroxyacetone kinase-like predicted kinase
VVIGGAGLNPSVGEILAAVEGAPGNVVILPNHGNVVPAAEQAASRASKDVRVVPVESVPCGLSAAAAFNPISPLGENVKAMEEAATACRSGALTRAERDADTPAGPVKKGQWIGLAEDEPVRVGGSAADAAADVARQLAGPQLEVLTLILGRGSERDRAVVEESLRRSFPQLDMQVVDGGQPDYPFLIGVE